MNEYQRITEESAEWLKKGKWTKFLKALPEGVYFHKFDNARVLNLVKTTTYILNRKSYNLRSYSIRINEGDEYQREAIITIETK